MVETIFKQKIRIVEGIAVIVIPNKYIKDGVLWSGTDFEITVNTLEPAGTINNPLKVLLNKENV